MHAPSKRRKRRPDDKLNLTSIMDAIFIFIFFLLMSANFIKVFEINSPIPMVSEEEPQDDKKPLALTLNIEEDRIDIFTGVPSALYKKISRNTEGKYDLEALHQAMIELKNANPKEEAIIFMPMIDINYEELVKVMDSVRLITNTDEPIFVKGKDGIDTKITTLFSNILFGNIGS